MTCKKPLLILTALWLCMHLYAQLPLSTPTMDSLLTDTSTLKDKETLVQEFFTNTPSDSIAPQTIGFKANFKSKYLNDEAFDYNNLNQSYFYWQQLKKRIAAFLKKLVGYAPDAPNPDLISILVKILSSAILISVLIIALRIYLRKGKHRLVNKKNDRIQLDLNDSEYLMQQANFETLIHQNELKKAYRNCVRLYFLWLLKLLKEQKQIDWQPEKTNASYANELQHQSSKRAFNYLVYVYEYVWYGEFWLTDNEYTLAKQAFDDFIQKEVKHG